jgi:hypothetical protein
MLARDDACNELMWRFWMFEAFTWSIAYAGMAKVRKLEAESTTPFSRRLQLVPSYHCLCRALNNLRMVTHANLSIQR